MSPPIFKTSFAEIAFKIPEASATANYTQQLSGERSYGQIQKLLAGRVPSADVPPGHGFPRKPSADQRA
jgi:hypothetical protein